MRMTAPAVGGAAILLAVASVRYFGDAQAEATPRPIESAAAVEPAARAAPSPERAPLPGETPFTPLGALVSEVTAARETGCYKLVATSRASRPKAHELCERLGFMNYGIGFR